MFAKNYHLHWIAGRANILSKYITYTKLFGALQSYSWLFIVPNYTENVNGDVPLIVENV